MAFWLAGYDCLAHLKGNRVIENVNDETAYASYEFQYFNVYSVMMGLTVAMFSFLILQVISAENRDIEIQK